MCEVNECTHPPVCEEAAIALDPSGQPFLPVSPPLLGSLWLPSTYHPPLAMPGIESIVSSCPDVIFSIPLGNFVPSMAPDSLAHSYPCSQKWINTAPPFSLNYLTVWDMAKQMLPICTEFQPCSSC